MKSLKLSLPTVTSWQSFERFLAHYKFSMEQIHWEQQEHSQHQQSGGNTVVHPAAINHKRKMLERKRHRLRCSNSHFAEELMILTTDTWSVSVHAVDKDRPIVEFTQTLVF